MRALGLGLTGPHRTGKTTIARELAARNKAPLLESSASAIAKEMGLKVDAGLPFEDRARFQERVLEKMIEGYETQNGFFLTDRTPLDLAAYTLIDWHPAHTTPELDAWCGDYIKRCMDATSRYFFMVGVIQPGIPYVAEEGKPAPNPLYQEMLNTVVTGMALSRDVACHAIIVPRDTLDTETRVRILAAHYIAKMEVYVDRIGSNFPVQ